MTAVPANPCLDAALAYAARGWRVLPLHTPAGDGCSCGRVCNGSAGKHPRTRGGVKDASTDPETIRGWWLRWPDANVGIATGPESGLAVVDIDPRHDGDATFRQLELKHGNVPDTIEAQTGGGGRHIAFLYPEGRRWRSADSTLGPGVDTKGAGGYVVAPPSLHASGRQYAWDAAGHPEELPLAAPPAWLLDLVDPPREPRAAAPATAPLEDAAADAMAPKLLRWATRRVRLGRHRNDTGFALAIQARDNGLTLERSRALLAEFAAAVSALGDHPYTLDEAEKTLASAFSASPRAPWAPMVPLTREAVRAAQTASIAAREAGRHLTDLGNAERFADQHRADVRYAFGWDAWLGWDGRRWLRDSAEESVCRAKLTVRSIYREAEQAADSRYAAELAKHAQKSESEGRIRALLSLARSEAGVPVLPESLDADAWVLNVANGVLDLRSGALNPHDRLALHTKLCPTEYAVDAPCTAWDVFLERVIPDPELRGFLQRAVGYSLTGDTREQCLFVLHGLGSNGKSTFLDTVRELLGDYAEQTRPETFQIRKDDQASNDIARLKGARLVAASETESGARLAESLVKQMTGGEPLTARFLHREFFTFRPSFKVFLATNHKPVIRGTDHAIWRRVKLIPWDVTIPVEERDQSLPTRLRAELPGILAWAVRGCLEWQRGGLRVPAAVDNATAEYREEMDRLGGFFLEQCHFDRRSKASATELYREYKRWCEAANDDPISQRAFGMSLGERGLKSAMDGYGRKYWKGIGLGRKGTEDTDHTDRLLPFSPKNTPHVRDYPSSSVSSVSSGTSKAQVGGCPNCGQVQFLLPPDGVPQCPSCSWRAAL